MANIPYPPPRPLSAAEVLDLTFRIYRATVVKCLLLAGLGVIAGQLPNIYNLTRGRPLRGGAALQNMLAQFADPGFWLAYAAGLILSVICYAAVLLRQHHLLRGSAAGGEFVAALRRLLALIGLGILIALSVLVCFAPVLLASGALRGLLAVVLLIPASYVLIAVSCANTVLLVDGSGTLASYVRSWRLTAGSFWRLSIIYFVALVVLFVLYAVTAGIAGFLAAALGRGDVAVATATMGVVAVLLGAFATPFYTALALAVLGDLTVRKEGADLEQRISATA